MKKRSILALALALMMISPAAFATKVFLNGVEITGVRNKTFKKAKVTIDAAGDIHVNAPGYEVRVVDEKSKTATLGKSKKGANPNLKKKYFMALQGNTGLAQYDLVVKVNGVERKVIKAGSKTVIEEISAWLKKGKNTVEVTAKKNLDGGRKSTSKQDKASLVLGSGHVDGKTVKIDAVNAQLKVNASQLSDITKTYTINAH